MEFGAKQVRRLTGNPAATVLEIGCNDGTDTNRFLITIPRGRVHCFECDPRAIAKWRKNIKDPRATLHEVALADAPGERIFHQSEGTPPGKHWEGYGDQWDMSGSLLPVHKHTEHSPWLKFEKKLPVRCETLDGWFDRHPEVRLVDFAWVDVQGAEALVLRGGQRAIRRIRWWYCEIDPRQNYHNDATFDEVNALLPGFKFIREYGGFNFLWRNDDLRPG